MSKLSLEPGANLKQQGNRTGSGSSKSNEHKRTENGMSKHHSVPAESLPYSVLVRLVWKRFKRLFVAFRFQADKKSFGLLRPTVFLKVALLVLAAYLMLYNRNNSDLAASMAGIEGVAVETSMDLLPSGARAKKVNAKTKNEAAPVSAGEMTSELAQDYIGRYADVAREEMKKFGIPASISLAQGLIESRAGTSKLAVNNNNHFGIKCFSRQCRKGHCSNFTDDTHKDFFRKFKSPWESWRAHSQLLASGRYKSLKKHGRNYKNWAYGLKSIGYATDRTYAEKLIGIIERYDLHQYDR